MSQQINESLAKTFTVKFQSKQQMKDWIFNFLGLDLPDSYIDPDSNSSPLDWMYEIYKMYDENRGSESPSVIVISSRESYKTLSEAMFAVIAMVHFGATIAHMAAIVPQATAATKYVEDFVQKVKPYLDYHKIELDSKNSKELSIKKEDGTKAYVKIIVCTLSGANSSHTNIFTIDEVDTVRSKEGIRAYKEAEMIPGVFNGQHPITIKTSTMKFPGGLFAQEIEKARKFNYKTFKWNLIDITEYCSPGRHFPDLPKKKVFISKRLPLETISPEKYADLIEKKKEEYDEIEAMHGCSTCPLLPVCKGRLAARSPDDRGGLWKPIDFTISQFQKTDPDLAEAQLMCWKPSSQGMVYPRFLHKDDGQGNTYTLAQAYKVFTGNDAPLNLAIHDLTLIMLQKGIKFYAGVDWGFRHAFAIVVSALLPNGEWWIMDTYSVSGLEFDQMMDLAKEVRDKYRITKWFADTAQPMFIKTFKKNGMPCAEFKKDVLGGIEAVRAQIIDAKGKRKLKVILHDRNEWIMKVFAEHTFMLDSNGNLTKEPDDSEVADAADALRYKAQNLFSPKGKVKGFTSPLPNTPYSMPSDPKNYDNWLSQKVRELTHGQGFETKGSSGSTLWNFGDPDDKE